MPKPAPPPPLRFKVAPNIVEDLGLNLYTELPRVLAEFVANAYDADSPHVDISIDLEAIAAARTTMRLAYQKDLKAASEALAQTQPKGKGKGTVSAELVANQVEDLGTRELPADILITVEDAGTGMSRDALRDRFLVAGRRRRKEDPANGLTKKGRLIMGRKGLGKLAGFGVAKRIQVVTRAEGESHATKIHLIYDELVAESTTEDIEIKEERLEDGGGFATSGTKIILSGLLYDPSKSQAETISHELQEHFEMIRASDFEIRMNGKKVQPLVREWAFAWPKPTVAKSKLVDATVETEEGAHVAFKYRMRFVGNRQALPGARRGVRVYVRGRLASAPSLLDANTNMHGFRMTDYLDGVVEADFLDNFAADFIATNRQSLRWESPLLSPMKSLLSAEIKEACKAYQAQRDEKMPGIVKQDKFTLAAIAAANLSGSDETLAIRIGTHLASALHGDVKDKMYIEKFPQILKGIGQGNLLAAIASLAEEDHPDLDRVAAKIVELTHEEMSGFLSFAKGRIGAITALKKIVEDADFKGKKEEKKVQALLEQAPWMVDSTYGPAISADESLTTLFGRLAKELKIGSYAPKGSEKDKDRPDLVFLLGAAAGVGRLVVVELKAANVTLESAHLDQLLAYMSRARKWLKINASGQEFAVRGHLIGMLDDDSTAQGVLALLERMQGTGPETPWRVRSFIEVLNETQQTHAGILAAHASAKSKK